MYNTTTNYFQVRTNIVVLSGAGSRSLSHYHKIPYSSLRQMLLRTDPVFLRQVQGLFFRSRMHNVQYHIHLAAVSTFQQMRQ